jgi:hypothetical protein
LTVETVGIAFENGTLLGLGLLREREASQQGRKIVGLENERLKLIARERFSGLSAAGGEHERASNESDRRGGSHASGEREHS